MLKCHIDPKLYKGCITPILSTLECGHKVEKPCYLSPEDFACPSLCETVLECGHCCSRICHFRKGPNYLEVRYVAVINHTSDKLFFLLINIVLRNVNHVQYKFGSKEKVAIIFKKLAAVKMLTNLYAKNHARKLSHVNIHVRNSVTALVVTAHLR